MCTFSSSRVEEAHAKVLFWVPYSSCLNPLSPLRLYLKKRYTMSEVKACRRSNSALLSGCCKVCSLKLFWIDGWREALNICYIGSFKSYDWHYTSKYTSTAKTWAQSQPHCKLEKVQMPVDELQDHLKAPNSRKRPSWGHALDIYQAWHIWSLAIHLKGWHKQYRESPWAPRTIILLHRWNQQPCVFNKCDHQQSHLIHILPPCVLWWRHVILASWKTAYYNRIVLSLRQQYKEKTACRAKINSGEMH